MSVSLDQLACRLTARERKTIMWCCSVARSDHELFGELLPEWLPIEANAGRYLDEATAQKLQDAVDWAVECRGEVHDT